MLGALGIRSAWQMDLGRGPLLFLTPTPSISSSLKAIAYFGVHTCFLAAKLIFPPQRIWFQSYFFHCLEKGRCPWALSCCLFLPLFPPLESNSQKARLYGALPPCPARIAHQFWRVRLGSSVVPFTWNPCSIILVSWAAWLPCHPPKEHFTYLGCSVSSWAP